MVRHFRVFRTGGLVLSILDGAEIGSTDMEITWSSTVNRVKD